MRPAGGTRSDDIIDPMRLRLTWVLLAAAACGSPPELAWEVSFASEGLAPRAVRVVGEIRSGGCAGERIFTSEATRGEMSDAPPDLDPGVYGFAAEAVDANCAVFAAGCTEVTLPGPSRVVTTLVASMERTLCAEARCSAGRCDSDGADAGDGGPRDVGRDVLDAGDLDGRVDSGCTSDVDCGDCARCMGGTCAALDDERDCPGGVCIAGLCCRGCVQDGACEAGTADDACGGGGDSCATCTCPTDACRDGACEMGHVVEDVAAGAMSTCVLVEGRLSCFGDDRVGQLAQGGFSVGSATPLASPSALSFDAIGDGDEHFLGLSGGQVFAWGDNQDIQLGYGAAGENSPTPMRSGSLTAATAIEGGSGGDMSCALVGTRLFCFGQNDYRQVAPLMTNAIGTPTEVMGGPWSEVGLGHHHSCAVTGAGALFCWGRNQSGQLGLGDAAVGPVQATPARVGTASDWESVEGGDTHTCGIRAGTVHCWGNNSQGSLGDGTQVDRASPTPIADVASYIEVQGGTGFTCGLRESGALACWGANAAGQLGRGTITTRALTPARVGTFDDWTAFAVGEAHVCAIRAGGALYCWGANTLGQLGQGDFDDLSSPTAVCW